MSSIYTKELLDRLTNEHYKCIIVFRNDEVRLGQLGWCFNDYELNPLTINESGIVFRRSDVKKIILFNGYVFPKTNTKSLTLDILELNELVNKAGYEFI